MQQGGTQFMPAAAYDPFGAQLAQPQAYPYAAPQAYPYAPPQPQPQPQPQAAPVAMTQAMPFILPQAQPQSQPQPQAAPVQPVAFPGYNPAGGQQPQQQNPAQAAQQAYLRQFFAIARHLEHLLPGYQVLLSLTQEAEQAVENIAGLLVDCFLYQGAALGAIRRVISGEVTNGVLTNLAVNINQLGKVHSQLRPLVDRLITSTTPERRAVVSGLSQCLTTADAMLGQALNGAQAAVGPAVWEAARTALQGAQ